MACAAAPSASSRVQILRSQLYSHFTQWIHQWADFWRIFTNIVPTDVGDYTRNGETEKTIQEFQRQGGEAAEYANMMTELTKSQE